MVDQILYKSVHSSLFFFPLLFSLKCNPLSFRCHLLDLDREILTGSSLYKL